MIVQNAYDKPRFVKKTVGDTFVDNPRFVKKAVGKVSIGIWPIVNSEFIDKVPYSDYKASLLIKDFIVTAKQAY